MRIYELARELGQEPKDVLVRAQRLGMPVTTVLHSLDRSETSRILDSFADVRSGGAAGPDRGLTGGSPLAEEHDPVTAVTIISVAGEGATPDGSDVPTAPPQESFSVVEDRDDVEFVQIREDDAPDAGNGAPGDAGDVEVGDPMTAAAAGGEQSQALLHLVGDNGEDAVRERGASEPHADATADATDGDIAVEPPEGSDPSTAAAAPAAVIPRDPWGIDAVIEELPDSTAETPEIVDGAAVGAVVADGDADVVDADVVDGELGDEAVGDVAVLDGDVVDADVVDADVVDADVVDGEFGDEAVGDVAVLDGDVVDADVVDGELGDEAVGDVAVIGGDVVDADVVDADVVDGELAGDADLADEMPANVTPLVDDSEAATPGPDGAADEGATPSGETIGESTAEHDHATEASGPVVLVDVDVPGEPASEAPEDAGPDVLEPHSAEPAATSAPLDQPGDRADADVAPDGDAVQGGPVVVAVPPSQPDLERDAVSGRAWPWRLGVAAWASLIVAVAVVGAVLTTSLMPQDQRAESDVIVRLSGFDSAEIDRQVESYVVAAESQTVVGPVAAELGISEAELRNAMSVGLVADSAVLRFAVEDEDGQTALASTRAIVDQYLLVVNTPLEDTRVAFVDGEIIRVEESLASTASNLTTIATRRSDNAARRAGLVAEQNTLQGRLFDLYSTRSEISSGIAIPGTSLTGLQAEIDALEAQLDEASDELEQIEATDSVDSISEAQLLNQQAALEDELARLRDRRVGLGIDQLAESRARASVLTPPYLLEQPLVPSAARGAAFGLAVGLILAVLFVVLVSWLRRRQ